MGNKKAIKGIIRDNIKIALTNNVKLQQKIAQAMGEQLDPVVYVNLRNEVIDRERQALAEKIKEAHTNLSGVRRKEANKRGGEQSFACITRDRVRKALTEVENGANLDTQIHAVYDELFAIKATLRKLDDITDEREYNKVYQYARSAVRLEIRRHVSILQVMEFDKEPMFDSEVDELTRSRVWKKK